MKGFPKFWAAVLFLFYFVPLSFGATVDIMIVYDTTAKTWVDSNGGMNAFAADAVARMNEATVNSGVGLTFRLAHTAVTSYTYSGDLGTDLNAVTYDLANVHTLRDTYGVDLVVLLVDTGSENGTVGMGWLLSTASGQQNYAFSACAIRSVAISHTMSHEVGHNFGCDHSKYMLPASSRGPGLYSYSAGWYFTGTNSVAYSTIMAYTDDGYGHTYVEAPLFSTPDSSYRYQGTVAGDAANGDNARTIRETMDVVAAYRTAAASDSTPDQFTFTDQTNVALSKVITSNEITVSGINAAVVISIIGGTYSINGGIYRDTSSIVHSGDKVTVQVTSSGSYSTKTDATLNIGGVSDTLSVTTKSSPDETPPDQFTFVDQTGVALNTMITSNEIMVSGIISPATISITGGEYSINGGSYTNESGLVNNGNTVTVQQTSSGSYSTTTDAALTIGGVSDTFRITTKDKPASGGDGSGGGGGGCFIATAAFGSPLAGQVEILRQFRDRYLLTNASGKKFVDWYYRNGPVASNFIKDKPVAKVVVQMALYPLIGFSLLLIYGYLPFVMIVLLTSTLLFLRLKKKSIAS